ncbi:glycerate kinase [Aeromicrobium sp. 9AM]|uniref:glycerate kinase family protein n=1 Tax=Aeromicrobium sp. 9AM TaxID=2653126 RepID=UPI0012F1AE02|nr:glycerate kinase [Aeromicrobium sp. 9AM]VXB09367.1 Glycerate kinase [Aeromicrobium sp. 9AM]
MTQGTTILVAPDSFKGTFSAMEVAEAIGRGIGMDVVDLCPLADGGEGTVETMVAATRGRIEEVQVHDPIGRTCLGKIGWLDHRTAVIESASASGLTLVDVDERDPLAASTYGTGELIVAARLAGARRILLGVGGTATTDGGLNAIRAIELAGGLGGSRLEILCDVRTPFEEAAKIYSAQKGASPSDIRHLTKRLRQLALKLPRNPTGIPGSGAGGGLAGGLWSQYDARLVAGAQTILDSVNFNSRLESAVAVVTGEGCFDAQTLEGKLVAEVVSRAAAAGVPVHIVAGSIDATAGQIAQIRPASIRTASTPELIRRAGSEIRRFVPTSLG